MTQKGRDLGGWEYKRTSNDFYFRRLEQDNGVCSICHGTGAKIEVRYRTRNYMSAKGKICKNLQAHEHYIWLCLFCMKNFSEKFEKDLGLKAESEE